MFKALRIIKVYGISELLRRISRKLRNKFEHKIYTFRDRKQLQKILEDNIGKKIIVFPPLMDWNVPLFQRPQHIAHNLAKEGFLYFYCTGNLQYDNVYGFQQISNNCYLTNRYDLLLKVNLSKVFHLYSTNMSPMKKDFINLAKKNGDSILYEYIDEIHEDISGKIPEFVLERHKHLLQDEQCIVVASADKLYKEVLEYRSRNCALVTNGVDYEHFNGKRLITNIPEEIRDIVKNEKPIIGYFGAFARWFDYELIKRLANERSQYQILLIGWNYDNSIRKYSLDNFNNIRVIGPIKYEALPLYSSYFDVSIIPFKINDITDSTSPIKLFEYMAMGSPIVTTNMPECRKYNSVMIGENHSDFIKKIDVALSLKENKEYKELMYKEALLNTWNTKAKEISKLLLEYKVSGCTKQID
ncbi:glycosyltransferase [Aneurinibacillus migulanus]|uniref:glycosyltransferase n=1 Tax=Aneurinibacillus migulanus TaxID=47500 RepID=UPI002E23277A|nr:glycosyltransferase [Aneurinibacillus migulanus]